MKNEIHEDALVFVSKKFKQQNKASLTSYNNV